ncbi:ATP-binding protein [Psychroflexus sp. CAK57W]|uniref:ATP-binding protein n=1 Tax=Psychroflexus curvus TaxID=2873595 RepID=UPI001CC99006|nr:ATP-binding protein [Psychroflexus curvus]MBZ9786718.1 ATP-binding protein [Psychroflexus curvus]
MKFYNREKEISLLREVAENATSSAQMTFMVGRRRIGKTSLMLEVFKAENYVYLFIARKNEAVLCNELISEIQLKLDLPIYGEIKSFKQVFQILMDYSKRHSFTLIIDEFQELQNINPSIYSDMQHIWDSTKEKSKINLLACGSIYSMMTRIFENSKEPLFGRATQRIHLRPFNIDCLKQILGEQYPTYTAEDLLAFYLFTGGVAKYVELIIQAKAFTKEAIIDVVLAENSIFLDEGKNVLIEELGKEYGNYFSILSLIASGKTSRVEIESIMEMQTGGFLKRLESEYYLVKKIRPILAKPNTRKLKYAIEDNFLSFWFRFIFKHKSAVEMGNLSYLKEVLERDYKTYSGLILEKYFTEKLSQEKKYNQVGRYWEKANQNEIDIVAVNDIEKKVVFAEVKRQKGNISLSKLKTKSLTLQQKFNGYTFSFKALSLEDM